MSSYRSHQSIIYKPVDNLSTTHLSDINLKLKQLKILAQYICGQAQLPTLILTDSFRKVAILQIRFSFVWCIFPESIPSGASKVDAPIRSVKIIVLVTVKDLKNIEVPV